MRPESFSLHFNGVRIGFGHAIDGAPPAAPDDADGARFTCLVKVRRKSEPLLCIPRVHAAGCVLLFRPKASNLIIGLAEFEWHAPVFTMNGLPTSGEVAYA